MFWKKKSKVKKAYHVQPFVAQSELDLALVKEVAFLEGVGFSYPQERKIVGQHRVESSAGIVTGIVPIYEDQPSIIGGGHLYGWAEKVNNVRVNLGLKKVLVQWGVANESFV